MVGLERSLEEDRGGLREASRGMCAASQANPGRPAPPKLDTRSSVAGTTNGLTLGQGPQALVAKDPDSYIKGRTGTDISKKFSRTHGTFADWPFKFWPTRTLRVAESERSKGRNLFTWNQARYAELAKELAARE